MTCATARVLQPNKRRATTHSQQGLTARRQTQRGRGQEYHLHQNMKFFSATLLHVLHDRSVRSTCLVASFSTPRHGGDRGLVATFACLLFNAHCGLFTTCGHSQGVRFPRTPRMRVLLVSRFTHTTSTRSPGRQQLLKAHVLEVLVRILSFTFPHSRRPRCLFLQD